MSEIKLESKPLQGLFSNNDISLRIPEFQRAYEWKSYHVKNLLNDTYEASQRNKDYLMGTIILHHNNGGHDIIDGQQRLVTLTIILKFLRNENLPLLDAKFNNQKSFYYIQNTQNETSAFFKNKTDGESYKNYILKHLNFSVLMLSGNNALDLAYTFFDSGNSKGKTLTDFDLLKAHHLMYIPEELEQLARKHNDFWMSKTDQHKLLFSSILRRIRMWSRGLDRDNHSERNDFYEFISTVEPNEIEQHEHLFNRYMQPNAFRSWHRENDEVVLNMKYPQNNHEVLIPFEIPQTIEGGDSFFLYAKRYHEMFEHLFGKNGNKKTSLISYVYNLSKSITNDYIAMAFKAVMLLYYDKFGEYRMIEVATLVELVLSEMRFRWGNVRPSPIRIETTLSKVRNNNLIPILLNATIASHVVALLLNEITLVKRETQANQAKKESPTLKHYRDTIFRFYEGNLSKIKNDKIRQKVIYLYEKQ